jgi:hypothetical protein
MDSVNRVITPVMAATSKLLNTEAFYCKFAFEILSHEP